MRETNNRGRTHVCVCVWGVRKNHEVCRWSSVCMSVRCSWEGRLGPSGEGPCVSAWRVSTHPQWGWCIGTDTLLAGWRVEGLERWEAGRLAKRLRQWSPPENTRTKKSCSGGKGTSGVLFPEGPQQPSAPVSTPGPAYVCLCLSLLILLSVTFCLVPNK